MADLPPRLGEQQTFVLAYLAHDDREDDAARMATLSRAVATEFDTDGDRRRDPDAVHARLRDDLDEQVADVMADADRDDAEKAAALRDLKTTYTTLFATIDGLGERLTPSHRASVSRSVRRLDDRGLVDRVREVFAYDGNRHTRTTGVRLTDAGRDAGHEALRRRRDGRYALSFETVS